MSDFLRSNAAVARLRESILESIRNRSEDTTDEIVTFAEARLTEEVLGVREVYLDASRKAIDENYGSLRGYLESVGVTDEDLANLRASLLT
jgi:protein-tyrosine phosphatase